MEYLPVENLYSILLNLPYLDIISYCGVNVQARSICNDSYFWQQKALHDLNISSDEFYQTDLDARSRYVQLLSTIGNACVPGTERFTFRLGDCLYEASLIGDIRLINYFLSKGAYIGNGLNGAAAGGNLPLVEYFISKGATNLDLALLNAAKGGHL